MSTLTKTSVTGVSRLSSFVEIKNWYLVRNISIYFLYSASLEQKRYLNTEAIFSLLNLAIIYFVYYINFLVPWWQVKVYYYLRD